MIGRSEIAAASARFGAPDTQIIRDHLISHVLAAIADWSGRDSLTFFGGTALCRTWLPDLRLSEDVDLLVEASTDCEDLRRHVSRRLRRPFPDHTWIRLGAQHQVETWMVRYVDLDVRVQFAQWRHGWNVIPLATSPVQLRYSDVPQSVALTVPTPGGFATMKLLAWFDRHTPRDLFDLAALAEGGHMDHAALERVKSIAGFTPTADTFERRVPRQVESSWQAELGHQIAEARPPEECFARIRQALEHLGDGD